MSLELKLLSFENPVFRGYFTHAAILVFKMMIMAILTGRQRLTHRVSFVYKLFVKIMCKIKLVNFFLLRFILLRKMLTILKH